MDPPPASCWGEDSDRTEKGAPPPWLSAPFRFHMATRACKSLANLRKLKLRAVQINVAAEGGGRSTWLEVEGNAERPVYQCVRTSDLRRTGIVSIKSSISR